MKVVSISANKHIFPEVKPFLLPTVAAITDQLHIAVIIFDLDHVRKLEFGKLHFTKLSPVNISCCVQGRGLCVSLESHLIKSTVLLTALDAGYMDIKTLHGVIAVMGEGIHRWFTVFTVVFTCVTHRREGLKDAPSNL